MFRNFGKKTISHTISNCPICGKTHFSESICGVFVHYCDECKEKKRKETEKIGKIKRK